MTYVDVIVDNPADATDEPYTYAAGELPVFEGCRVTVPFGRGNRVLDAYVVSVHRDEPADVENLKQVLSVEETLCLTQEELHTALWLRGRSLSRYIEAIKLFVTGDTPPKRKIRGPLAAMTEQTSQPKTLTDEQRKAHEAVCEKLQARMHHIFLLFGVTGSGKTELYLQAMQETLALGRGGIVLVPEIALTPQVIQRFIDRFGKEQVAVIHSRLTPKQRYVEHEKIRNGEARVVIGARSAVFSPMRDIGLIVIDESHETSYKSDMSPKYDTLEVAVKRAMAHRAVVITGSATPSLSDYYLSQQGVFTRLELRRRANTTPLPNVRIADMRSELARGNRGLFSQLLVDKMQENLQAGKQIILFLNRRGYASFVTCRECDHIIRCEECGISMPYHKSVRACLCHYCGRRTTQVDTCPSCGAETMRTVGAGTQQVEEKVMKLFPDARTCRLDLDAIRKRTAMESILERFEEHDIDILIGTQLVAKGLDVKNVGLVGIVSADVTLNIPDFRSAERTFQLITQAAGRAGRGEEIGDVVIQTYTPEHEAIQHAVRHDYEAFYRSEIAVRKRIQYPPFGDLFQLVLSDPEEAQAERAADRCVQWLAARGSGELIVMGPRKAALVKERGAFRYQVLIKSPMGRRRQTSELLIAMRKAYAAQRGRQPLLTMDVNPYSFL